MAPFRTTRFSYDALGRPQKEVRLGDDWASPTILHAYYDDVFNVRLPFLHGIWYKAAPAATPWRSGGTWVREFYDGLGRLIQTQTPYQDWTPTDGGSGQQIISFTRYNTQGQPSHASVPYLRPAYVYMPNCQNSGRPCNPYEAPDLSQPQTVTAYDGLGRVTRVTAPDGTFSETWYTVERSTANPPDPDFATPQLAVYSIDANRHFVRRAFDAFGQLNTVTEFLGVWGEPHAGEHRTRYTYDVTGQLTQVTDAAGNQTTLTYDRLGRKTAMRDPDMGAWHYRYDATGNLTKQRDARDQVVCFYYDGLNRLRGKTYHANTPNLDALTCPDTGHAVTYSYDQGANGLGRRTGMTDASGSTSWTYDARGRVITESKTIGGHTFSTHHSYRADDRSATLTYPDGEVLTYGYDAAGHVTGLSGAQADWGGAATTTSYLIAATYTALGEPLSRSYGNGAALGYGYHPTSYRLTTLTAPGVNLGYTYQNNGNVATLSDSGQVTTFTYDALDRLTTATGGYSASYSYDPNGNLRVKTEGGATVNLSYPAANQPRPHAPASVNSQVYGYDANGNLATRPGQTFIYDAENRLQTVTQGAQVTTFTYDGDGNLVKQVAPAGTTLYVGAHYEVRPAPVAPPVTPQPTPTPRPGLTRRVRLPLVYHDYLTVDGQPAQAVKYYLVGGQRIASRTGSTGPATYYYHDHLGSAVASSGGEQTRYWPYGATRSGSIATAYQFTGQRREPGLGLYFYRARWYDPVSGRFRQADTLVPNPGNPQSLNRYPYVLNDPLTSA